MSNSGINPQAPVAQKIADEVVFRRFQGEGVEFFLNRTSRTPIRFYAYLLENTDLSPSRLHFQWFLYQDHVLSQMVLKLIRTNEIEEKERCLFTLTNL